MVKNLPANAEDLRHASSIHGLGKSLGADDSKPLYYFLLEKFREQRNLESFSSGIRKSLTTDIA